MKSLEHIIREIVSKKKLKETEPTIMSGVFKEEQQLDEVLPAIAAAGTAIAPEVGAMLGAAGTAGAAYLGSKLLKKMPGKSSYDPEAAKSNDSYATVAQRMKTLKTDIPAKQEIKPGAPPPIMSLEPPKAPEKLSADRPSWPGIIPAAKPAGAPPIAKPATPEAPPIQTAAGAKPTNAAAPATTKPATDAIPAAKVGTQAPAIPQAKTTTATDTAVKTDTATKADTSTKADTKVDAKTDTATKADTASKIAKGAALAGMALGLGKGSSDDPNYRWGEHRPLGTTTHRAPKHKMHEEKESEGTKIRKQVTNVGRPWTTDTNFSPKSKLAKQAEIKTKIIDESKKLAGVIKNTVKEKKITENDPVINGGKTIAYPQVVINPPMKTPDSKET